MAIGPVGNAIYVHQNMHIAASKQTDQLNRFEIQNFMAAESLKDKEKEVMDVRPPEATREIDPDRDQHAPDQQEHEKKEKSEKKKLQVHSDTPDLHILDIKV